jgi:PP-loop superfamily ATP-utilizing enzyme
MPTLEEIESMNMLDGLLSEPGGMSLVMDLLMADEREEGEDLICDYLPGMRAEYERVKAIIDAEIAKKKIRTDA